MQELILTDKAIQKIKELRAQCEVPEDYALRIGVKKGGGRGPVQYSIGFDTVREEDIRKQIEDISILLTPGEAIFVLGMKVDWRVMGDTEGFYFTDPTKPTDE